MYNYQDAIADAITDYLNENVIPKTNEMKISLREYALAKYDELLDDMMLCDSVTGSASGSYTMCRSLAKVYVLDNEDILADMYDNEYINEFDVVRTFIFGEWERMDVTIRCYLLPTVWSTHGVFNIIYK